MHTVHASKEKHRMLTVDFIDVLGFLWGFCDVWMGECDCSQIGVWFVYNHKRVIACQ